MDEVLSIIVPVYNGERYLAETVDAILSSEYKQIEVLLIDDGSSDQSADICKRYEQLDQRVRYIYKKNGGIVTARNRGLEEASGVYVCFCDQDDITASNMYSCMIQRMQNENAELCMCGTARFYEDSNEIYEAFEDKCYQGEQVRTELLHSLLYANMMEEKGRIHIQTSIWKCIIRKDIIDRYGLRLRRFVNYEDDWILLVELLAYCNVVSTVSITGYLWRTNLLSESHAAKYVENIEEKQKLLLEYMKPILVNSIGSDGFKNFCAAKSCVDIIKILENENSLGSKKTDREKKVYFQRVIGDRYTLDVEEMSKCFAKGCIRYKIIYFFIRRGFYMSAYYANYFLQFLIYLLHRIRIGNKLERLLKG